MKVIHSLRMQEIYVNIFKPFFHSTQFCLKMIVEYCCKKRKEKERRNDHMKFKTFFECMTAVINACEN